MSINNSLRLDIAPERATVAIDLLDPGTLHSQTWTDLLVDSEGFLTPASIISYLGHDIDSNYLRQEIINLKSNYEQSNKGSYFISVDGVGKS